MNSVKLMPPTSRKPARGSMTCFILSPSQADVVDLGQGGRDQVQRERIGGAEDAWPLIWPSDTLEPYGFHERRRPAADETFQQSGHDAGDIEAVDKLWV